MTINISKQVLIGVACFFAGVGLTLLVVGTDGDDDESQQASSFQKNDSSAVAASAEGSDAAEAVNTDLESRLASCTEDDAYKALTGSVRLINPSEDSKSVTVSFAWLLGDGSSLPADGTEDVEVAAGGRELVFFEKPVPYKTASSFTDHPDWFNSKNCEFEVSE